MSEDNIKFENFLKKFKDTQIPDKKSVQLKFTRSLNILKPTEKISDKKKVKKGVYLDNNIEEAVQKKEGVLTLKILLEEFCM